MSLKLEYLAKPRCRTKRGGHSSLFSTPIAMVAGANTYKAFYARENDFKRA